jgi:hypothetical protein
MRAPIKPEPAGTSVLSLKWVDVLQILTFVWDPRRRIFETSATLQIADVMS